MTIPAGPERRAMVATRVPSALGEIRRASTPVRYLVYGFVGCGFVGVAVGTVIGLRVHALTAWAAAVEVGLPSAALGAVIGGLVGCVVAAAGRLRPRHPGGR
ncbi:hypothetical protein [Flexivirga oryzae]|uniref:Presenilin-like A22 family membrane protease n=1 Tax=Flexivirga oryzae TaxID=1794944 RepID=A0A839N6S3_9MICO|nr:hypothetical protein [Flexivirga oryzae]MBB2891346.1 presenilin-like A22 family membrane protease [Flexivirga oryzae]